jgi:hypothetical protein
MTSIARKTREMNIAQEKQQIVSGIANKVANKAQIFCTQCTTTQVVTISMIEKMEHIHLQAPQVTVIGTDQVVQLNQQLHTTLDETDSQLHVFF